MELISDDDGNHFDLHTLKGNYEYLAAYLRKKVAASNIFASLGFIYQESMNLQQRLATVEAECADMALRYSDDMNYIGGIVERGTGKKLIGNIPIRLQLLEYVKELEAERDDYKKRLNPSFDYVDGQPVAIAEDEIDRLKSELVERTKEAINAAALSNKHLDERDDWHQLADLRAAEIVKLRAENERLRKLLMVAHKSWVHDREGIPLFLDEWEEVDRIAKQALEATNGKV